MAGAAAMAVWSVNQSLAVLIAWIGLIALVSIGRAYFAKRLALLKKLGEGLALWSRFFILFNLARGAVWGAGGWFLFPEHAQAGQLFLFLVIVALCAHTLLIQAGLWKENVAFFLTALAPVMGKLFQQGGFFGYTAPIAGLAFLALAVYLAADKGELAAPEASTGEGALLHKKLMEQAGEPIFIINPATGQFMDVNQAACSWLDYSAEDLMNMKAGQVEPRFFKEQDWAAHVDEIIQKGGMTCPCVCIRKDGAELPAEVSIKHILEGDREYLVAFARDMSAQKLAMEARAENERQLSAILESIPLSIMILDEKGLVRYMNMTSVDWYGISAEQAAEKPEPDIWIDPSEQERFHGLLSKKGFVGDFEAAHKRPGGETQWVLISGVKMILKGEPATMVTRRDVTALKDAQEGLRAAKTQAEEATELKDQFVSLVSHDLRSPLGSIQGLLRLLKGRWGDGGSKGLEIIDKVINASDMMVTMVDQLLDISRLKTGKIQIRKERFAARNFVEDCMETVDYLAEKKGVAILNSVPPEMFIEADRALFGEVINNLLSNAVKFCSSGQTIEIIQPDGPSGRLAVRDNGTGMDQFTRENIFRHEVKTTTEGTAGEKGTGLGLPYCHDIMLAHGGALTVESELGKGTAFYVSLPANSD